MYFHRIQNPKPVQSEAEGSKIKIVVLVFIGVLACFQLSEAQQRTGKVPRIGLLFNTGSTPPPALVQGLCDLGYVEGKNITLEYRTTQGNRERYADLAAELVRLKVDLIVADGSVPSTAARTATRTIPIVMTSSTDPGAPGSSPA